MLHWIGARSQAEAERIAAEHGLSSHHWRRAHSGRPSHLLDGIRVADRSYLLGDFTPEEWFVLTAHLPKEEPTITDQEKIKWLNTLEVVESEGGETCYVLVEGTEEVIAKLREFGVSEGAIHCYDNGEGLIDIVPAAFECGASYWTGSRFVIDRVNDAMQDIEELVREYWAAVEKDKPIESKLYENVILAAAELAEAVRDMQRGLQG